MNTTFRIECSYNKKNKVRNRTDTRVPVVKTLKKGVLSTGVFVRLGKITARSKVQKLTK